jgi:hypothetical protein
MTKRLLLIATIAFLITGCEQEKTMVIPCTLDPDGGFYICDSLNGSHHYMSASFYDETGEPL